MQKTWFTVLNVKVTARAYMIKIWQFLLYLLNCWLICNQTWFDSTASYAGVSCGKWDYCVQGLGHSEGSKCQWMFVLMMFLHVSDHVCSVSSEPLHHLIFFFFLPNLVWWCIFLMQCVMRKFWFTIFSATKFSLMVHHHKLESFVKKIRLLFLRSRSLLKFKTLLNLYASYIFCTTDLSAPIEGVLIYYS